MPWGHKRTRDYHVMFAVNYENGRIAYIRVSPKQLELGEHPCACHRPRDAGQGRDPGRRDQGREAGAVTEHLKAKDILK